MSKENVSILVANHNLPDITAIKTALSNHDDVKFEVNVAKSGVGTLKKASESKFDVLLMYQNLPGIDGIKMLKKITAKKLDMPVIMVVSKGEEKLGVKAMDEGAYDYLTRDEVKGDSLNRAIRRAIQRKKLENDIRESVAKLEKMAIRDGLTGLYNHRHFREEITNEYKKAKRHLQSLSCIMLDLDHFKSVNDNFGHQFGDFVITRSADILKMIVRDTDFVARYGGEEFFIILPNTDLKGAYILAERIRVAFANNVFKKGRASKNVTVSIGISSVSDDNVLTDEDLITNADNALYRAKWRGRNNVCTYEETDTDEAQSFREEIRKIESFYNRLQDTNERIKANCIKSAHKILLEIESGWDYINGHSSRVSRYAEKLTRKLLMSEEEISTIKRAAMLHDIGMVGISSKILRKKSKLTSDEYDMVKRHSNIGMKLMEKTKLFDRELPMILHHHERFDGKGYPHKLKGDSIPYGARILSIAEAFDTMMSKNDYSKAFSVNRAIAELRDCSGTQFDPLMVDEFVKVISRS